LYLKRGKNNRRTEKIAFEELHKVYSSLISDSSKKMKPEVKKLGKYRIRLYENMLGEKSCGYVDNL
jgi:hypothetical protein